MGPQFSVANFSKFRSAVCEIPRLNAENYQNFAAHHGVPFFLPTAAQLLEGTLHEFTVTKYNSPFFAEKQ